MPLPDIAPPFQTKPGPLRMGSWNLNTLSGKLPQVLALFCMLDCLALQQIRRPSQHDIGELSRAGIDVYHIPAPDLGAGGVMLLTRRDTVTVVSQLVRPPDVVVGIEVIGLELAPIDGATTIRIGCVYVHPRVPIASLALVIEAWKPHCLLGDFNAVHPSWSTGTRTQTGTGLRSILDGHSPSGVDLVVANTSIGLQPTYEGGTTLDLALVAVGHQTLFAVHNALLGSDHFPIFVTMADEWTWLSSRARVPHVLWHNVTAKHWAKFTSILQAADLRPRSNVNRTVYALTAALRDAIHNALPSGLPAKGRLLPDALVIPHNACVLAWKAVRAATPATAPAALAAARSAEAVFNDVSSAYTTSHRHQQASGAAHDPRELWKLFRSEDVHPPNVAMFAADGSRVIGKRAQCDKFASLWEHMHRDRSLAVPPEPPPLCPPGATPPPEASAAPPPPVHPPFPPISMPELEASIRAQCHVGAADADDIPPHVLTHLPHSFLVALLALFNESLSKGVLPHRWLYSIFCPSLKRDKDPTRQSAYRPVALTALFCRLLERIIEPRMLEYIRHKLSKHQYGFLKGLGCDIPILDILRCVSDGQSFRERESSRTQSMNGTRVSGQKDSRSVLQQSTLLFALDMSDAFCCIPPSVVVEKLRAFGCPEYICVWVLAFLSNRTFRVRHGSRLSVLKKTVWGAPQGSILGPLLWIVHADSLAVALSNACLRIPAASVLARFGLLADDLGIWLTSHSLDLLALYGRTLLQAVTHWARENHVDLSAKSEGALIDNDLPNHVKRLTQLLAHASTARWGLEATPGMPFACGGINVPILDCIRYLGVWIDMHLSFATHVEKLVIALRPLLLRLKRLADYMSPPQVRQLYCGAGLSRMLYAAHAWWPHLSVTLKDTLESLHGQFAGVISGAMAKSKRNARLIEARLRSLEATVDRLGTRRAAQFRQLHICQFPAIDKIMAPPGPPIEFKGRAQVLGPCFYMAFVHGRQAPGAALVRSELPVAVNPLISPLAVGPAVNVHFQLMPAGVTKSTVVARNTEANVRQLALSASDGPESWSDASIIRTKSGPVVGASAFAALYVSQLTPASTPTVVKAMHLHLLFCSFSGELVAIREGLSMLLSHLVAQFPAGPPPALSSEGRCVTDSLSSLLLLRNGPLLQSTALGQQCWLLILDVVKYIRLRFVFIFSHANTPRSTFVDAEATKLAEQCTPDNSLPTWFVDEARAQWGSQRQISDATMFTDCGLRSDIVQRKLSLVDELPLLYSIRAFVSLSRNMLRLIAQLRAGQCPSLPGWKAEAPERCPLCASPTAVLSYHGAVIHMFECPSRYAVEHRRPLDVTPGAHAVLTLFSIPLKAANYAVKFFEGLRSPELFADRPLPAADVVVVVVMPAEVDAPAEEAPPVVVDPPAVVAPLFAAVASPPAPVAVVPLPAGYDNAILPLTADQTPPLPAEAPPAQRIADHGGYLTLEQTDRVCISLARHGNAKIGTLTVAQVRSLTAHGRAGWLSNYIVNDYGSYIMARYPKALVVDALIAERAALSDNLEFVSAPLLAARRSAQPPALFLFPCLAARHWTLLAVVPGSGAWHYDSLQTRQPAPPFCARLLEVVDRFRETPGCAAAQIVEVPSIQHQSNSNDCGVFVCQIALHIAKTFESCRSMTLLPATLASLMTRFRHVMQLELIEGRLQPEHVDNPGR